LVATSGAGASGAAAFTASTAFAGESGAAVFTASTAFAGASATADAADDTADAADEAASVTAGASITAVSSAKTEGTATAAAAAAARPRRPRRLSGAAAIVTPAGRAVTADRDDVSGVRAATPPRGAPTKAMVAFDNLRRYGGGWRAGKDSNDGGKQQRRDDGGRGMRRGACGDATKAETSPGRADCRLWPECVPAARCTCAIEMIVIRS